MTLWRMPDPSPDTSVYGNSWAKRPCRFRDHRWVVVGRTELDFEGGRWHREIRRCERCGSQVHQAHTVEPPRRGTL